MQAHIYYRERLLTFQYEGTTVRKRLGPPPGPKNETPQDRSVDRLTPPARTEMIVRLPVNVDSPVREGLVERSELLAGVYLAENLVRVDNGSVVIIILNTREQELKCN
jgi:hypothetical protein